MRRGWVPQCDKEVKDSNLWGAVVMGMGVEGVVAGLSHQEKVTGSGGKL